MPFQFSAFISYRHLEGDIYNSFMKQLYKVLSAELALRIPEKVFLDVLHFNEGNPFSDKALAECVFKSVCMIQIYTPRYFDFQRPYCAKEYSGMEKLEQRRLALLPENMQNFGLIIPIILRGKSLVPKDIWNKRICHDFEDFFLSERLNSRKFYKRISDISSYIAERCNIMRSSSPDPFSEKNLEGLPVDEEIAAWLASMVSERPKLPGRNIF